jgi:SAM-dependent methyltransferase
MTTPAPAALRAGEDLQERVRAYWNERIHDLEMTRSPVGSAEFFRELDEYRFEKLDYLPRLVDFAGWRGRRVLEIGCGVGTDLVRFARSGAAVTGVDLSQTAVDLARRNLQAHGCSGEVRLADGGRTPFPEKSFDLVYCHGVLQYAADPGAIVRETRRLVTPAGEAVFMVYNRRSWLAWMSRHLGVGLEHGDAPVLRLYTAAEFARLLAPFGEVRLVPERFPVVSRLHGGLKGVLFNRLFVPAFHLLPRRWVRPLGWHLMAFCRAGGGA